MGFVVGKVNDLVRDLGQVFLWLGIFSVGLRQLRASGELTVLTASSDRSADEDENGYAQHNRAPREERDYESGKARYERDGGNDD